MPNVVIARYNSPTQLKPLGSRTYPGVQLQTYDPGILMQACAQRSLLLAHSSMSEIEKHVKLIVAIQAKFTVPYHHMSFRPH